MRLGFWQLDRAEQKEQIVVEQQVQEALPPLQNSDWRQITANHLRQVQLSAIFDSERYLLLANRTRNSQVGYEVIALAYLPEQQDRPVLVNRGWVPASFDRTELPDISHPEGMVLITGYYYCSQPNSMISQPTEFNGQWPAVVFDLSQEAVEQIFAPQIRPQPCEVRLDSYSPLAFEASWQIINQSVEKHIGYAVQWFSMAFALIILALFANSNLGRFFAKSNQTQTRDTSGH